MFRSSSQRWIPVVVAATATTTRASWTRTITTNITTTSAAQRIRSRWGNHPPQPSRMRRAILKRKQPVSHPDLPRIAIPTTTTEEESSPFAKITSLRTVFFHVFVGICSASFWRGSWYILDDTLFPNQKELSAISSLLLGTTGMVCVQGAIQRAEAWTIQIYHHTALPLQQIRAIHALLRFGAIYSLVVSVVCVWRGTWMSWDLLYAKYYHYQMKIEPPQKSSQSSAGNDETTTSNTIHASDPGHAFRSGMMSHVGAVLALCSLGIFSSVFAPPAAISIIRDRTVFSTKTIIQSRLYNHGSYNRAATPAAKNKRGRFSEKKMRGRLW
jgi:Fuseless